MVDHRRSHDDYLGGCVGLRHMVPHGGMTEAGAATADHGAGDWHIAGRRGSLRDRNPLCTGPFAGGLSDSVALGHPDRSLHHGQLSGEAVLQLDQADQSQIFSPRTHPAPATTGWSTTPTAVAGWTGRRTPLTSLSTTVVHCILHRLSLSCLVHGRCLSVLLHRLCLSGIVYRRRTALMPCKVFGYTGFLQTETFNLVCQS